MSIEQFNEFEWLAVLIDFFKVATVRVMSFESCPDPQSDMRLSVMHDLHELHELYVMRIVSLRLWIATDDRLLLMLSMMCTMLFDTAFEPRLIEVFVMMVYVVKQVKTIENGNLLLIAVMQETANVFLLRLPQILRVGPMMLTSFGPEH